MDRNGAPPDGRACLKRAIVLGGGGVIGVAWETGLISGLAEGGVDVRQADVIVGTSAGSIVGTRIAGGQDVSQPAPNAALGDAPVRVPPVPEGGPDMAALGKVFGLWTSAAEMTQPLCAEIGGLAAAARTADEETWVAATGGSTGVANWPALDLRITAVDVESGAFEVHTRDSGAPLDRAVASSCAVPGMFPPITIGGRRYMDGGVRSGTSADVLIDVEPDVALVIAPLCKATASFGALCERSMNDEVAQLRAAGARVCSVLPGDAEVAAFGGNLMDASKANAARQAGHTRGLVLAQNEAAIWFS